MALKSREERQLMEALVKDLGVVMGKGSAADMAKAKAAQGAAMLKRLDASIGRAEDLAKEQKAKDAAVAPPQQNSCGCW